MNAGRIRSLAIVGVLFIAAVVLVKITISDDKQSHTSYANTCPAGTVPIITDPLPDYDQINLKLYNGSTVPGAAESLADELSHRGFKVAKVGPHDDKPTTPDVADLYYGPKTVAAAWVVRAEFLLSDPTSEQGMHFSLTNKSDVVEVVIGRNFRELGAKTEVNQAIAALKTPTPPPGTCADNP
jgi:LytR cell envelope-related transcriptional attenuator